MTYANVVATLALFLVIAGGTAFGVTYVVSSNSQIGPNTVSGHKPPTGKHSNLISGSVNGTDLSANSVNSSKVTDGSLTGSDLAKISVASALQVRTGFNSAFPGDPPVTLFSHGPWTLTGTCNGGPGALSGQIDLSSSVDAVASVDDATGSRFTGTFGTHVAITSTAITGDTIVKGGHFSAWAVGLVNHLSGNVLVTADAVQSDFGGQGNVCLFTFEGLGS
jgi:hypothetical protein